MFASRKKTPWVWLGYLGNWLPLPRRIHFDVWQIYFHHYWYWSVFSVDSCTREEWWHTASWHTFHPVSHWRRCMAISYEGKHILEKKKTFFHSSLLHSAEESCRHKNWVTHTLTHIYTLPLLLFSFCSWKPEQSDKQAGGQRRTNPPAVRDVSELNREKKRK